jgi:hypothetical protein
VNCDTTSAEPPPVHLARIVCKDAKVGDFFRKITRRLRSVRPADPEQNHCACLNFCDNAGFDSNAGPRNTLNDGAHEMPFFRRAPRPGLAATFRVKLEPAPLPNFPDGLAPGLS